MLQGELGGHLAPHFNGVGLRMPGYPVGEALVDGRASGWDQGKLPVIIRNEIRVFMFATHDDRWLRGRRFSKQRIYGRGAGHPCGERKMAMVPFVKGLDQSVTCKSESRIKLKVRYADATDNIDGSSLDVVAFGHASDGTIVRNRTVATGYRTVSRRHSSHC